MLVNKKSQIFAEEEGGEVKFRYFKTKIQNRLPDPLYAVQCHSPNKKCFDKARVSFRISKKLKVQPKVGGLWEEWASALNINAWSAKLAGQPK